MHFGIETNLLLRFRNARNHLRVAFTGGGEYCPLFLNDYFETVFQQDVMMASFLGSLHVSEGVEESSVII